MAITVARDGTITLRCYCCGLPWGRIQNGALIVQSRHHGEAHINAIAIMDLLRLGPESGPDGADGIGNDVQRDHVGADRAA